MLMDTNGNTKELIKDLCSRLPYGVMVREDTVLYDDKNTTSHRIKKLSYVHIGKAFSRIKGFMYDYGYIYRPYLFPLSSMTEDMMEELNANGFFKYRDSITNVSHLESKNGISEEIYTYIDIESISFLTEYFHSHHIDYRGLIEKGLAIDATGLNIY